MGGRLALLGSGDAALEAGAQFALAPGLDGAVLAHAARRDVQGKVRLDIDTGGSSGKGRPAGAIMVRDSTDIVPWLASAVKAISGEVALRAEAEMGRFALFAEGGYPPMAPTEGNRALLARLTAMARGHEGPEGDDPGAHAVELEAVRGIAQDVAHGRAVAQLPLPPPQP